MSLKGRHKVVQAAMLLLLLFSYTLTSYAELVRYTYDDLNRLERVEYGDGTIIQYIYDEVGNRDQKIIIKDPDIWVTPYTVDFGSVNIGDFSDQTITVENRGAVDLIIDPIYTPPLPFANTSDTCSGQVIAPSFSCTIGLRYQPTEGISHSDWVVIPSNDPDENPAIVILNGHVTGSYHQYDTDQDWAIGNFELLDAIDDWADGIIGNFQLLDLIDYWAFGSYCWDTAESRFKAGTPDVTGECTSQGSMMSSIFSMTGQTVIALRDLPDYYIPGTTNDVSITIDVDEANSPNGIIIDENLPAGWEITSASHIPSDCVPGDINNACTGMVNWLFWGALSDTTISYTISIPDGENGAQPFNGELNYIDPANGNAQTTDPIGGETTIAIGADTDNDGIFDDGDGSGIVGDNTCTGGNTVNCDDNCVNLPNPDQADTDNDGRGDLCDYCNPWTDPAITAGVTPVTAQHFTELKGAIVLLRDVNSLLPYGWASPEPAATLTIKAVDMTDMRDALGGVLSYLGRSVPGWDINTASVQGTPIMGSHIEQLRQEIDGICSSE